MDGADTRRPEGADEYLDVASLAPNDFELRFAAMAEPTNEALRK